MPLTIGIENGLDKGFTENELGLTNGFAFGVVCMHAGVSRIGEKGYGTIVSAEEAHARFKLVLDAMPLWDDQENSGPYKWLTDLDNIKRLEEHDWYCNAGTKTTTEFLHDMRNIMIDNAIKGTPLDGNIQKDTYREAEEQKGTVRTIIGCILSGNDKKWHDDNNWIVEELTHVFEPYDHWDLSKPFYDGQYLVYGNDGYTLSDTPQEDE